MLSLARLIFAQLSLTKLGSAQLSLDLVKLSSAHLKFCFRVLVYYTTQDSPCPLRPFFLSLYFLVSFNKEDCMLDKNEEPFAKCVFDETANKSEE